MVEVAEKCMKVTEVLAKGIQESGFKLIRKPELNLVGFKSDEIEIDEICQ